jgi:hypothetical protein
VGKVHVGKHDKNHLIISVIHNAKGYIGKQICCKDLIKLPISVINCRQEHESNMPRFLEQGNRQESDMCMLCLQAGWGCMEIKDI